MDYLICLTIRLPLPQEVPMSFRVLPEYIIEDIVDSYYFSVQWVMTICARCSLRTNKGLIRRTSPDKFELSGKTELMTFVLIFLTSTWYIKNPFLKSKINDVCVLTFLPRQSSNLILRRFFSWASGGMAENAMGYWGTCSIRILWPWNT